MTQVIFFVFDGLQAELVTPELMPRLSAFTAEGVRLERHQPVFPTVTRVNASSIVTGCFPGTHGLPGNRSLIPEFHPTNTMNAMRPEFLELRERAGHVLLVPTLAEVLAEHSLEYVAIGIGSTGQSFVHLPNGDDASFGATIHPEYALPLGLSETLHARFGAWPASALPNAARIERMIDIGTEYVIAERDPAVALFWCSEPDGSQHGSPLNSPRVHAAVRAADAGFGRLLDFLEESGRAAETNVIVTCDHGHSTVDALVPMSELLAAAGFAGPGAPGGVVVADNGGAVLLYVPDHDAVVVDRLATYLMAQHWAGPILVADRYGAVEGTHPTSLVGLYGARGPDLAVSFSWDDRKNEHGQPGYAYATGGKVGQGQHGSMSPRELRTFTAARGPAFHRGVSLTSVSGHPDLAPTVLRILGIDAPPHMDGRAIEEALVDGTPSGAPTPREHVASRDLEAGRYTQRLIVAPAKGGGHLVSASAEFVEG
ncbi:MAG: alkaline phosphatase family protein [Chloroflexi bacterium]|nr:alkaline phosphatase family protein [Chloroflexota bacterium]MDA1147003.1 alkaline phosphatase family protein [Chloroflexota bacterium]